MLRDSVFNVILLKIKSISPALPAILAKTKPIVIICAAILTKTKPIVIICVAIFLKTKPNPHVCTNKLSSLEFLPIEKNYLFCKTYQ